MIEIIELIAPQQNLKLKRSCFLFSSFKNVGFVSPLIASRDWNSQKQPSLQSSLRSSFNAILLGDDLTLPGLPWRFSECEVSLTAD
ncbi:MAG: hypothetical protein H8M99_04570 [Gloeobacteraceae cyanobacterium ES-bin-144]|nr:hypothetical protein [Verrucomicrobiales bacterium]